VLPERQVGMLGISNGAQVNDLGVRSLADYNALDPATLKGLSYGSERLIKVAQVCSSQSRHTAATLRRFGYRLCKRRPIR